MIGVASLLAPIFTDTLIGVVVTSVVLLVIASLPLLLLLVCLLVVLLAIASLPLLLLLVCLLVVTADEAEVVFDFLL